MRSWGSFVCRAAVAGLVLVATTGAMASSRSIDWVERYTPGELPTATDIAAGPSGERLYVAARALDDQVTVAYDADTGDELWRARAGATALATGLAVAPDDAIVVTAGGVFAGSDWAWLTIARDAVTGDELWRRKGLDGGWGADVEMSVDGSLAIVTGRAKGDPANPYDDDAVTVAYDASTGATVWKHRFLHGDSEGNVLATSPDGTAVVVGGSICCPGSATASYLTIAYSTSSGRVSWWRPFAGSVGAFWVTDVAVSSDSATAVVTGAYEPYGRPPRARPTIAYDVVTGAVRWMRDGIFSGAVEASSSSGRVFLAGTTEGYDYALRALRAADGRTIWLRRIDGPAHRKDRVADLARPQGGWLCATGSTYTGSFGSGWDYFTVCVTAGDGQPVGVQRRYDGPAMDNDFGSAVVVDPGSASVARVFVTGESTAISARLDRDIATVGLT